MGNTGESKMPPQVLVVLALCNWTQLWRLPHVEVPTEKENVMGQAAATASPFEESEELTEFLSKQTYRPLDYST